MGWSVGYDNKHERDIGYGVPAICDSPGCGEEINRGLSYVCGGAAYGGDSGCGLFFCGSHRYFKTDDKLELCAACRDGQPAFKASADTAEWINWKLTDESWQKWRNENPEKVGRLETAVTTSCT